MLPKGEGPRHFDILTAIDLGHIGAREARRLSHSGQCEREGGQDQVLDGIPKGAPLTRNQRIKRVHAADDRRRIEGLAQPSRNREEAENEAQQQHQEDGPHEARCYDAEQRKEPSYIVDRGVAVARGDDAERHAHQHHDQPGGENELQRRREGIDQIQGDRAPRDQRFAEVAPREPLDEFPVLDRQRFVQMQAMAQLLHLLRRRHGTERHARRIARNDAGDHKDQDRKPHQDDDCRCRSSKDEPGYDHMLSGAEGKRRPPGRGRGSRRLARDVVASYRTSVSRKLKSAQIMPVRLAASSKGRVMLSRLAKTPAESNRKTSG